MIPIEVDDAPIKGNFTCSRSGNCCHHMMVFLNCFDMERLAKIRPFAEWLDFIELDEEEKKEMGEETIPVLIDGKEMFPILQEKPDEACVFFGRDEKGLGGCTIWRERPRVCKTYPFETNDDGKVVFLQEAKEVGCLGPGIGQEPDADYLKDLELLDQESPVDEEITREWNKNGTQKFEDFVPFVLNCLATKKKSNQL